LGRKEYTFTSNGLEEFEVKSQNYKNGDKNFISKTNKIVIFGKT
jgi:hypothetical protein